MKSILMKMLLLISILVMMVSVALGTVSYTLSSNALTHEMEHALLSKAQDNAKVLEERMKSKLRELETIAADNDILSMDWAKQKALLTEQSKRLDYLGVGVVDRKGQAHYLDETTLDLHDRDYIQTALAGKATMSDIIISRKTNEPVLMLAVPIQANGSVSGALIARIDGFYLSNIVSDITFGDSGFSFIMDKTGTFLGHPDRELVVKQTNYIKESSENSDLAPMAAALTQMLSEQEGVHKFPFLDGQYLMGYSPIQGTDWLIVTGAKDSEIKSSLSELQFSMILFTVIALIIGIAVAYLLSRSITKPILAVQQDGRRLACGDFTVPVADHLTRRRDEIGSLAESFEIMRESLGNMISQIRLTADQVASSAEELNASNEQVTAATAQIAKTMEQVADHAASSATANAETSRAMEETNIGLRRIAESSTLVLDVALDSTERARAGNTTVQQARSQMNHIRDTVSQSSDYVQELIEQTKAIEQFASIIGQIANQTNLLALNASIEAARAGEHGQGFAVVANEVRKLAEASQQSAKEVVGVVATITEKTANVLSAMNKGKLEVESGVQVIQQAEIAFQTIVGGMETVTEQIQEISSASEQLSASADEVTASMEEMEKTSRLTARASENVSTATEEQMASMEEVASSSRALSTLAHELQEMISRFKS